MFGWLGPQPAPSLARALTRQQQIDSLRAANPFAVGVEGDPHSFDIGLRLPSGKIIRVRTSLPPGFPENGAAPTVRIVEAPTRHPWLDAQQRVAGSPELAAWSPSKNLGAVVLSIIQHFGSVPPVDDVGRGAGPQQLLPGPYAQQQQQLQQQQSPPAQPASRPPPPQVNREGGGGGGGQRASSSTSGPAGAGDARQAASGANRSSGGGGGGRGRSHTALPPIPSSFPELETLSGAELGALLDSPAARAEWVAAQEPVAVFRAVATSSRDEAVGAARANLATCAQLEQLAGELRGVQAQLASRDAELRRLLGVRAALRERYAPGRLARELAATASELDAQSELLAEAFCDPDAAPLAAAGPGEGGGAWDDGRSVSAGSALGGGTVAVSATREFREDYLALRKRFHMANAKVEVLQQTGLA